MLCSSIAAAPARSRPCHLATTSLDVPSATCVVRPVGGHRRRCQRDLGRRAHGDGERTEHGSICVVRATIVAAIAGASSLAISPIQTCSVAEAVGLDGHGEVGLDRPVEPLPEHDAQPHDGEPYAHGRVGDAARRVRSPAMETIGLERDGDVLIATIDHPDSAVNAVDGRLHRDLGELFRTLKQESTARAVVLTGTGKAFSAGGDMAWFPTLRTVEAAHALRREGKQIIWDLLDVEVPIVCGLNGSAAGLGASIALLCDVIVMADDAVIVDPHVKVGLVAGDGGAAIWPLLLGPLAAKRHLMLGDPLTAADALRLGVAAEVCPAADVATRALAWADRLAAGAPLAVQGTKQAVNAQIKQALLTSFDVSTALEIGVLPLGRPRRGRRRLRRRRTPRLRRAMTNRDAGSEE